MLFWVARRAGPEFLGAPFEFWLKIWIRHRRIVHESWARNIRGHHLHLYYAASCQWILSGSSVERATVFVPCNVTGLFRGGWNQRTFMEVGVGAAPSTFSYKLLRVVAVKQLSCTSRKSRIGASGEGMCFWDRSLGLYQRRTIWSAPSGWVTKVLFLSTKRLSEEVFGIRERFILRFHVVE